MLFIISSSNNGGNDVLEGNSNTWIISSETATWNNLDELINMLDWEDDIMSEEVETVDSQEKKWFFSFFKRWDDSWDNVKGSEKTSSGEISDDENKQDVKDLNIVTENNDSNENEEDSEGIFSKLFGSEDNIDKNSENKEDSFVVSSNTQNILNESGNLVKDTGNEESVNIDYSYAPEVKNNYEMNLPGYNLETAIGNRYELAVKSLKLNNKYFNETLWYLSNWDIVTQISAENSYGCFEVTVEKNAKQGYVCKKWFIKADDTQNTPLNNEENISETVTEKVEVTSPTYIWDQIIMNDAFIVIDNLPLERGDIVDQLTDTDMYGCFTALVRQSYIIPTQGQTIQVCHTDIK